MKLLTSFLIVITIVAPCVLLAEPGSESSPEQQAVLKVEEGWLSATKAGDLKHLQTLVSDDFTLAGPTGQLMERDDYIGAVREKVLVLESAKLDETKVRVYGDAAVVTGVMIVAGRHGAFDFSGTYRFTDTLIKHDGKWQKVAGQMTAIH